MAPRTLGFDINPAGTRLFIVQTFALVLATLSCCLRVYVKVFIRRRVLMEDWMMVVATLIYFTCSIIILHSIVLGGTGLHTTQLTQQGIIVALRAWYLGEVLYVPTATLIRTAIAFFLMRIAVKTWHIWVTRVNIAMILIINFAYFIIMVVQCTPPSFFWEGPAKVPGAHGSCINKAVVPISTIAHSVLSAISDWILALLPIAMLWNVQINLRTKISVAVLLSFGLVAGIALVLRASYVKDIAISADFLHDTVDVATWSVLEPALGIIAGCIATLRPLFKTFGLGLSRRSRKSSSSNNNNNKNKSHSGGSSGGSGGRRLAGGGHHHRNSHHHHHPMQRLDTEDDDDTAYRDGGRSELGESRGDGLELSLTRMKSNGKKNPGAESAADVPFPSKSSRIFCNVDAFGNPRDQRWEIESGGRPPSPCAADHTVTEVSSSSSSAGAAATDGGGINVHTTFRVTSQHDDDSSSTEAMTKAAAVEEVESTEEEEEEDAVPPSNTSSSSRDLPLQGEGQLVEVPPPAVVRR